MLDKKEENKKQVHFLNLEDLVPKPLSKKTR